MIATLSQVKYSSLICGRQINCVLNVFVSLLAVSSLVMEVIILPVCTALVSPYES